MAELHPILRAKTDALGKDVQDRLFALAATMSTPFWWHGPTSQDPEIYHNGTLSLIDTGERAIGVTASHVYTKYLRRRDTGKQFVCQFGGATVYPEDLLIDENKTLDLATFDVSTVIAELAGQTLHRPPAWPPQRPKVDDVIHYGGFPGSRRRLDLVQPTFGLDYITGLVSDVTPINIIIKVDYSRLADADGPEGSVVASDAPGTSGGSVYRIIESPGGAGLEIAGFITEQWRELNFILARHADLVRPDGTISG
jgi:hypothetical protein